jgi:flagellar biogenesis protein FliO
MSKSWLIFLNTLKRFSVVTVVVGVCFFQVFPNLKVLALDSNSPLFEQNQQTSTSNKENVSTPLALPEETPSPSPWDFSTLVRLLFGLSLTIGLIVATIWILKFVWEKRGWNNQLDEGKPIKVLTSTYLSPRKVIHLVEVGKRILVIGAGTDEMNCLDVITQPEEVEALRQTAQQGFPKVFSRILQKHETIEQEEETQKIVEESRKVVGGYVDKLKKISQKKKTTIGSIDEEKL